MISFFQTQQGSIYGVQCSTTLSEQNVKKLVWLFGDATPIEDDKVSGVFKGPRATMISPWSTNAVEITQNMGIQGILRIEHFTPIKEQSSIDPMIYQKFLGLDQGVFDIHIEPEAIQHVEDIEAYNQLEGLALSADEVQYLVDLASRLGRPLTDAEVFGFSQVNSEHCRHKIFNGTFIIDGDEKSASLFSMIKKTSKANPNEIVSAYKDNVAFIKGPKVDHFAPEAPEKPSKYSKKPFDAVLSLKAETHNFPTTVEPFNGAATGSGGEIRDRMAGGQGSIPSAGTALYMTSYPRINDDKICEQTIQPRPWLYQKPIDILIKASNGASDFGNKFGQPLICGSLLTFEHEENGKTIAFDKVIMQAGGVGYGSVEQALKKEPETGDIIVILGGDNYRIGMGGAAVSSADTGAFESGIELNAVQRSNPEMQKRVCNTIRALVEHTSNPIISIHDHGAGGHLNCLSELVEDTGGVIQLSQLPIGDPTLSAKEIIGNESQERMGLIISENDYAFLKAIAERERAPIYKVGVVTGNHRFTFESEKGNPIDLELSDMFGNSPKTIMRDATQTISYSDISVDDSKIDTYLKQVLQMEAVACKDWLTNKVDRCVGGKVAMQQCTGPLQLPLNNCGIMALDFDKKVGIATSMGHAPIPSLIDSAAGARIAITEALTNLIWAPIKNGLDGISLSANWMWPCKNPGEDARLYEAVQAVSDYAIALGINVPTGKDSLSMAQKYSDKTVLAPGTVVISTIGSCIDFTKAVTPVLQATPDSIFYIDCSKKALELGGSTFAQTLQKIGTQSPDVTDAAYFKHIFQTVQQALLEDEIISGHDISAGGMITTLLEMCFPSNGIGMQINLSAIEALNDSTLFFAENNGLIIQGNAAFEKRLKEASLAYTKIGTATTDGILHVKTTQEEYQFDIAVYRDIWYKPSYLFDTKQTSDGLAEVRFNQYKEQPLTYTFPESFVQSHSGYAGQKPIAAIIREKGSNSEREMANALFQAGFEVRDVHMTDLITGRETLEDVQFLGAVGGFSNSDVLGSAKGWAGAFKYNEQAQQALQQFFKRSDTLSVGICNGCQLFLELDLLTPERPGYAKMVHNNSKKHESSFTSVTIQDSPSIMLKGLEGSTLGVWISHGEGKFSMPLAEDQYAIAAQYGYNTYPGNPNGSDFNTAMLCSLDGRHLATMPHIERSFYAWNWPYYPRTRKNDGWSPWGQAFVNAFEWCLKNRK